MSAVEGRTDMPFKRGHFRLGPRLCDNSDVELARRNFVSITLNRKRTTLAVTVEGLQRENNFALALLADVFTQPRPGTQAAPDGFGWQYFKRRSVRTVKNPDRYAAAICIRVRPDCLFRGYSVGEICACPCCEGHTGPWTLSVCYEVFAERLLLFPL